MSTQTNSVTSKKSELLFNEIIELTEEEAKKIVGGFNPQPDPPIFSKSQRLTFLGIQW
ncbi:hypothetical protein LC653_15170 [Nostoc sp. CHAB 5784]|uniref:hypothetical protein n=1 Tax=Nostoc mirabile TaxID=2907820 RepID=UPI001E5715B5|nr:hypothetical protein [Nostoc mirabile]MCC5665221.1 hypothetical protein [Nostoc mirabile CHAB5784]